MADFMKPTVSAEDAEISSMINMTAKAKTNRKPQQQNENEDDNTSLAKGTRHSLRKPQGSPPTKRTGAETTGSGEKRGRGRPRKEQSNENELPHNQNAQKPRTGALKMPSKRLGRGQNAASETVGTAQDTFDVPDDAPNPNMKPIKAIGNRKQPQRNSNLNATTAGADAAGDAATTMETNKKHLLSRVKQAKAKAITEHAKSLDEAGISSTNPVNDYSDPSQAQTEMVDLQDSSAMTLGEVNNSTAPLTDEGPTQNIDQLNDLREAIGATTFQTDDAEGDPDWGPSDAVETSFLSVIHPSTEAEALQEERVSASRDAEGRPGKATRKRKRGQVQATDENTLSPDLSDADTGEIELFGLGRPWWIVMKGAREVGFSHLKGHEIREKPPLATKTVKGLVDLIKEATALYNRLEPSEMPNISVEDIHSTEERLTITNGQIFEEVQELSEEKAGDKKSEIIQDIYAHAIPNLVFWLRAGMKCRTEQYRRVDDIGNLKEIVRNQDLILELCEKARRWKAKPLTDRPITNTTSNSIKPYLRDIRKTFNMELEKRERLVRHQSNELALAESHERRLELQKRQKQFNDHKKAAQRQKILQNLREKPSPYRRRDNPSQSYPIMSSFSYPQSSYPQTRQTATTEEWTDEQNHELVAQLMRPDIGHLPGKPSVYHIRMHKLICCVAHDRYLHILNAPLLQNKLPEHIRERALYYKDIMMAKLGPQDYITNIE